jgi:hypothetical protein
LLTWSSFYFETVFGFGRALACRDLVSKAPAVRQVRSSSRASFARRKSGSGRVAGLPCAFTTGGDPRLFHRVVHGQRDLDPIRGRAGAIDPEGPIVTLDRQDRGLSRSLPFAPTGRGAGFSRAPLL